MNQTLLALGIGAGVSTMLALASVRMRYLTLGGAFGAIVIGTVIYGYSGWTGYLVLLSFYLSSSLLTKLKYSTKAAKGASEQKAGARNIWQTIGQGGVAAAFAAAALFFPVDHTLVAIGVVGALAEANADTWAVELGILSRQHPRLITQLSRKVLPGKSGGVSCLGELSAVAGSVFVTVVAGVLGVLGNASLSPLIISGIAAVIGEHVDSVLGATVQAAYYCPTCRKETERKVHRCGTPTEHVKGFELMTNEAVNFISTATAAVLALALYMLF